MKMNDVPASSSSVRYKTYSRASVAIGKHSKTLNTKPSSSVLRMFFSKFEPFLRSFIRALKQNVILLEVCSTSEPERSNSVTFKCSESYFQLPYSPTVRMNSRAIFVGDKEESSHFSRLRVGCYHHKELSRASLTTSNTYLQQIDEMQPYSDGRYNVVIRNMQQRKDFVLTMQKRVECIKGLHTKTYRKSFTAECF